MIKKLKSVLAGLALVAVSATASATVWTSTYDPNPNLSVPPTRTWEHNLGLEGFEAGTDTLSSFILKIWVYDDSNRDGSEGAEVDIVGSVFGGSVGVGSNTVFNVQGQDNWWTWWIDEIAFLESDGKMTVTLSSDYGDFVFDKAVLYATGTDNQKVPEPGSLALLGAGLAGLAFTRRRQQK